MKKTLLSLLLLPSLWLTSVAQQRRICATPEVYQRQIASNPAFALRQQQIEAFTQQFIKHGGSQNLLSSQRGAAQFTIPVVVHVIWNTAAQNISDEQVQSQIDVLNKDFQLLNADTTRIPSVFQPLKSDVKVQFCLAKTDPAGNPTSGIVRVQTTKSSFGTNDNVKFTSKGGDDAWDASRYLNLWVCNLSFGVLGYAQFPGGNPATDGVVILYKSFGLTNYTPYNLGRTATHEVGHWLNLRHIWGDDGNGCTGSDLVDDTPNQGNENYGKPSFPQISCNNGPNGDMFMNYMDYVDDDAMQMFSLGQKDRMWAILQPGGARQSLATSGACDAVVNCTDIYEPNDTKNTAAPIALNTDVKAIISSAADKDIFRFNTVTGATSFTVTLSNLPKNYVLRLYNANAQLLAESNNSGTADETITFNSSATATYGILVSSSGSSEFDPVNCYNLKVTTTSGTLKQNGAVKFAGSDASLQEPLTIYPQPVSTYANIRFGSQLRGAATINITNSLGQVLSTSKINIESNTYKLPVSKLKNGLYYVKVSNSSGTFTTKIVVQH